MNLKVFGKKLDVQTLVLGVILGLFICRNLYCGCRMMEGATGAMEEGKDHASDEEKKEKKEKKEEEIKSPSSLLEGLKDKIENLKNKTGMKEKQEGFSGLGELTMGGVEGSYESQGGTGQWRDGSEETHQGTQVPLPAGEMFFFADNKFSPQCRSSFSSSTGQACLSKEQIDYLNQRGGNRTFADGF